MKVLIVDDTPSAVQLLIDTLSSEPYTLLTATTGFECLEVAEREQPDVILLDVMLPGLSGFDVCQRLRQTPVLADVTVLMLTALDDRRARLSAFSAGADDFLTKPFDRVELRLRLRGIARLNRFRRLLERSELVSATCAQIAHDATTLLLGARLVLERAELDGEHAPHGAPHVATALDAVGRASTLMQSLSRFERIDRSTNPTLDLNQELRETEAVLRAIANGPTVRLELADGDLRVPMQPAELHQVLSNLVANARAATGARGHITIRTTRADETVEPAFHALEVIDDGAGMTAEVSSRILEPYFTTKPQGGTGLGLSSVHSVVARHGGTVHVDSRPGAGTTFTIGLPATLSEAALQHTHA